MAGSIAQPVLDFITTAAHRVRTPLATVRPYAEATLQRVEKGENREAMRPMVKAIDESSGAAGQLLDHAMITFRADHLERENIDLVALVRDLVQRMTPIAELKDLSLSLLRCGDHGTGGAAMALQPALMTFLDAFKRAKFLSELKDALIQHYGCHIAGARRLARKHSGLTCRFMWQNSADPPGKRVSCRYNL